MAGSQFTIAQIINPQGPAGEAARVDSQTFSLQQVVAPRGAAGVVVRIDNVAIVDPAAVPATA
jgi:hypothetical protein